MHKMGPLRRYLYLLFGGKRKCTTPIYINGVHIGFCYNSLAVEKGIWEPPVFTSWARAQSGNKYHYFTDGSSACISDELPTNYATFSFNPPPGERCKRCESKFGTK